MKITITAELTDEQALILAKEQGYQEVVWEELNPISPADYIKSIYENMIIDNVSGCFINHNDRQNKTTWELEEKTIKDNVTASIVSEVI